MSVKVRNEVQSVFVKSFQSRSGLSALLKISARCRRRTRLNGRLVRNDRRLPDQNRITGQIFSNSPETATLFGLQKQKSAFTPIQELRAVTDFKHRIPKESWWLKLRPLLRILAKHETTYVAEDVKEHIEELESGTRLTS